MRTRCEIETRMRPDGLIALRIYDDYWDSVKTAILDKGFGSPHILAESGVHKIFEQLGEALQKIEPSKWYALQTENYPFGAPTEMIRIPGRHLVYRDKAREKI